MSGATFPRIKNWTTEVLSNTDLNAEIDNILNNLGPVGVGTYSTNAAQMQITTNPGTTGAESLATSLAGELERLRFVIQRLAGSSVTNWYDVPSSSITDLVASLGSGLPKNRITGGRTTGNSSQLCALIPSSTTASLTLTASVTPLSYYINGTAYSITANQTITGLVLAGSTNMTCQLNATQAVTPPAGQQWTRAWGQFGTTIPVKNMGSGAAAAVGKIAAFKTGTEFFLAYVSSTVALTNAWRGCFFNQSASLVKSVGISNNDVITLCNLTWVFANSNSSMAVTYNNPTVSAIQPTGPATGDYWFDLGSTAWKTFNSTTWVAANATLIGMSVQDTAACVAARTFDSYSAYDALNSISLNQLSSTAVQANARYAETSVFGTKNNFGVSQPTWTPGLLDSGIVFSASTSYFMYLKENGTPLLSDVYPQDRRDLRGLYHPGETWRCIGAADTDTTTAFLSYAKSFRGGVNSLLTMMNDDLYGTTGYSPHAASNTAQLTDVFPNNYIFKNGNSATWPFTAAQYGDFTTISLTQGLWAISAVLDLSVSNTANGTLSVTFGVSLNAGNNFADAVAGLNAQLITEPYVWNITGSSVGTLASTEVVVSSMTAGKPNYPAPFISRRSMFIPRLLVRSSTTLSLQLKGNVQATAAAIFLPVWSITAERIDSLEGTPR